MNASDIFSFVMIGAFTLAFAWFFYRSNQIDKMYADKPKKH